MSGGSKGYNVFLLVQFSRRLSEVSEKHTKMVEFWMDFMKEHKDVLLNCPIIVEEPQLLYTSARTEEKDKAVIAVYSNGKCITLNDKIKKNIILNGIQKERVIVEFLKDDTYEINVRDCSGVFLRNEQRLLKAGLECIQVPVAGIVEIKSLWENPKYPDI